MRQDPPNPPRTKCLICGDSATDESIHNESPLCDEHDCAERRELIVTRRAIESMEEKLVELQSGGGRGLSNRTRKKARRLKERLKGKRQRKEELKEELEG